MPLDKQGKNIWYVHPYAGGPGLGSHYRPYELCRAWNEDHGCSARVIFPSFHHLLTARELPSSSFRIGPVEYHALPAPRYYGNGIQRVAQMAVFSSRLGYFGRQLVRSQPESRPDYIISSSPHPLCVVAASRLARRFGASLVFEMRDLWPLSLTELGEAPPRHPFVLFLRALEKYAFRQCDLVASVLPRANQYLHEQGFEGKKFVWVPNGLKSSADREAPTGNHPATTAAVSTLLRWKDEGRVCCVYVGSMGASNGLKRLVEALSHPLLAQLRNKLGVLLVGSGAEGEALKKRNPATMVPLSWSPGAVPSSDVRRILQHADFAYAGLLHAPNLYKYGLSLNKLPDYMGAGVPVILPCDPCGDPVSESGGGLVSGVAGSHDLAEMIMAMSSLSQNEREKMGQRGCQYITSNYNYRKIASTYLGAFSEI